MVILSPEPPDPAEPPLSPQAANAETSTPAQITADNLLNTVSS